MVVDHAFMFECNHFTRRGSAPLNLGFDCRTGHEVVRAITHSYIPINEYVGGHVTPGIRVICKGEGEAKEMPTYLVIPNDYISVAEIQPLES
jgi:hypothetical protein